MLSSISDNTIKQYNSSFKLWWKFCSQCKINTFEPEIVNILTFLAEQFNKGGSYGTINTHRSALSLLIGGNLGSDDQIKRLMKGIYKKKPSIPKYRGTWDPQLVLNFISKWFPNRNLPLEKITKKLCVLLAICTGHRVQTLSLIKISNINKCADSLQIPITEVIKTSAAGRDQPVLILPYFRENPSICPSTTLNDYVSVTSDIRVDNEESLFITYKKPHRKASSQSLSRWIKQTLAEAGVDVSVFSAHSTRHASTSAAASTGVSIDVIRKAAGWSSSSQTFARFYNRPILDEGVFARSVCSLTINNEHTNNLIC
ncbi:uncharacterized protein LOC124540411 [Vanessa cardui]|uniref:uncharacterized protein LOC124540411 n=1 Tax=Vanessa cardui TaxID=171605 RepID=UPI001F141926|nr:uncharacterized protein LOC124540411 [Vanessa cardui]